MIKLNLVNLLKDRVERTNKFSVELKKMAEEIRPLEDKIIEESKKEGFKKEDFKTELLEHKRISMKGMLLHDNMQKFIPEIVTLFTLGKISDVDFGLNEEEQKMVDMFVVNNPKDLFTLDDKGTFMVNGTEFDKAINFYGDKFPTDLDIILKNILQR